MTTTPEASIFTKIINREIPADIIYEDDDIIAFLTIEPITAGHTLVVPKEPFVNIFDAPKDKLEQMMTIAQKIAQAQVAAKLGESVNLIMNNGPAAGQEVFHAHIHVVPRRLGDQALIAPKHNVYDAGQAKIIADTLNHQLN